MGDHCHERPGPNRSGYDQFKNFVQGSFGDAIPRFLMQLQIDYEDGTGEVTGTDQDWKTAG